MKPQAAELSGAEAGMTVRAHGWLLGRSSHRPSECSVLRDVQKGLTRETYWCHFLITCFHTAE